ATMSRISRQQLPLGWPLALCWLLSYAPVRAEPDYASRLVVRWHAAEGCPTAESAEQGIRAFVAQRWGTREPSASVEVAIERLPAGPFQAHLVTRDASGGGERQFAGASCARVTEAAIMMVTMALDALRSVERLSSAEPERKGLGGSEPSPPSAAGSRFT